MPEFIPKILANISYLGPTFLVLEFTNVGTMAAQNVHFEYSLPGVSDKVRYLKWPLLNVNETKTVYFQGEDGSQLGNIDIYKEQEITLKTKIQYHNALETEQTDANLLSTSQNINVKEFVNQNNQISVAYEEKHDKKIIRYLENISRHITDLSRESRQIKDVLTNQLHVTRLTMQYDLLVEELTENISDSEKLKVSRSLIKVLFLILMDPYPDLRNKEIQQKLNEIKELDNVIYEKVWEFFPSLKYARVEK